MSEAFVAEPLEQAGPTSGALAGIRVIELGMLIAGPFAGRLLGDMGAEVIKVEPPDQPDPLRLWGEHYEGRSLFWPVHSRNKKCITLNLRDRRGQELLLELVKKTDVVVENFRPRTLEKWNLGYEQLSRANPRLILARISGYGQTGPYASRAGFASVAEAMGGLRHLNGFPDQPPPRIGISLGDSLAGMFAVQGILAALYWRDCLGGGLGQEIDVSLLESSFALLEGTASEYDKLGVVRGPQGINLKGVAPSSIFKSRDGKWLAIGANQDNVFQRLCTAMGQPELVDDPRFRDHLARGRNQQQIERIVAAWVAERDAVDVDQVLNDAGVACGPVYTIADIFKDPHFRARNMLIEHDDAENGSFIGPGIVPKFSRTPGTVRWAGSRNPGSHSREIYCDLLRLDEKAFEALQADGVV